METNEQAQRERYREVERALVKLVEEIEEVEDGDVKALEQKIYKGVLEIGRKLFQCRMNTGREKAPGKQRGACGHEQHLVGYRTKQMLTMMGKVEFQRAYYQCQRGKEEQEEEQQKLCGQGRSPADQVWGIDQRRTTPGVQEYISYLCARLTFEEAAETFGVNPFYRTRGKVNFPALECKLPQTQQEADILNSNVISWYYTPVQ